MGKFLAYTGVAIFGFVLTGVLLILGTLLGGVVLQDLWGWFIVPFGLPELSLAHAVGINVIAGFLTYRYVPSKEGDGWVAGITPFVYILCAWGIGAVVHSFM